MISTKGYAAQKAKAPLGFFQFERREPREHDVVIEILYCGVCHSDIHQARDEWGGSTFPMVPGHEIMGVVRKSGAKVSKYKVGDHVGVGCMVDSCRQCENCKDHLEQFCSTGPSWTYNGREQDGKTPTQGGYSNWIVVDEAYTLKMPADLDLAASAPLLCAGITTYSPLRHWQVGKGQRVGIVGLGGLGHMGVKFAASFGAEVVVFTTSANKKPDALRLGAHDVVVTRDANAFAPLKSSFDFILNTVSAPQDLNQYLGTLKRDGAMTLVGVPDQPAAIGAFSLIGGRRSLAGSLIGGIAETQEMLDYCGKHNITSDVEVIRIQQINEAYERMVKADVKYRFSIDMASLQD